MVALLALRPGPATDSLEYTAEASREKFDTLGSLPLDDPEAVRAAFEAGGISDATVVPTKNRDEVIELARLNVADLFMSRFGPGGPDEYLQTWERNGYHLATRVELNQHLGVDDYYNAIVGSPPDPDADSKELFESLWRAVDAGRNESIRLTSIAADPAGIHTVFYRMNKTREQTAYLTTDRMDPSDWYGQISQGCSHWIQSPVTIDTLFEAGQDSVLIAETGVVADFARGGRRVLNVKQFWDPNRRRWWILAVNANNFTTTLGAPGF